MPRVHFVKKARKANKSHGIKKGDSYYWWKFRYGGKRVSKTPPKQSQLTQSNFLSSVYLLQEQMGEAKPEDMDELRSIRDDWCSEIESIRDECQSSLDNMPEQLREAETGQMLQERIENMDTWKDELESIDLDDFEPDDEKMTEEEKTEAEGVYLEEKLSELQEVEPNL